MVREAGFTPQAVPIKLLFRYWKAHPSKKMRRCTTGGQRCWRMRRTRQQVIVSGLHFRGFSEKCPVTMRRCFDSSSVA